MTGYTGWFAPLAPERQTNCGKRTFRQWLEWRRIRKRGNPIAIKKMP